MSGTKVCLHPCCTCVPCAITSSPEFRPRITKKEKTPMRKILVVVDMQNDFIDGSLGTKEAQAIVDNAAAEIAKL